MLIMYGIKLLTIEEPAPLIGPLLAKAATKPLCSFLLLRACVSVSHWARC